jgi:hypothetical protein
VRLINLISGRWSSRSPAQSNVPKTNPIQQPRPIIICPDCGEVEGDTRNCPACQMARKIEDMAR